MTASATKAAPRLNLRIAAIISALGALTACGGGDGASEPEGPDPRIATLPGVYAEADYSNGRAQFRSCGACHNLVQAGAHRVGPNLGGMFGRTVGEAEGFRYSPALLEAEFAWTTEQLDQWLTDPAGFLPGNRMSFLGVSDPDDRRDLIAYLLIETAAD